MSSVEVTFLGAMHCVGNSPKSGRYDFCQVKYAKPLEAVQGQNRTVTCYGSEEAQIDLVPSALHQFAEFVTGQRVKLEIGPNPSNLNKNLCTGVKGA